MVYINARIGRQGLSARGQGSRLKRDGVAGALPMGEGPLANGVLGERESIPADLHVWVAS